MALKLPPASPLRSRRNRNPSIVWPKADAIQTIRGAGVINDYINLLPGQKKNEYTSSIVEYTLVGYSFLKLGGLNSNKCQLQINCTDRDETKHDCFVLDARLEFCRRGVRFVACTECATKIFESINDVIPTNLNISYNKALLQITQKLHTVHESRGDDDDELPQPSNNSQQFPSESNLLQGIPIGKQFNLFPL